MHYNPRSNYGSKASLPTYYIPGGFCLPGQSRVLQYDVVPDLPAGSGMVSPRSSTGRLAAFFRACGGHIGRLVATSRGRKADVSATVAPDGGAALAQ